MINILGSRRAFARVILTGLLTATVTTSTLSTTPSSASAATLGGEFTSARPEPVTPYGVVPGERFKAKPPPWQLPVSGYHLTGRFGQVSGLWSSTHTGLDFAAPEGTQIRSIGPGVVTSTSYEAAYGNKTVVRLDDGTVLWYCHQSAFEVKVGQRLAAGDLLGRVGSTGNVTGPHLHLEVHPAGGKPVDPEPWLRLHHLSP